MSIPPNPSQPERHTVALTSLAEQELLREVARGDELAFAELYRRYRNLAFNFVIRVVKQQEAAEDLVSDIFTRLWVGKELLAEIENFNTFLYTVSRNRSIDFFRSVTRQGQLQDALAKQFEMTGDSPSDEHADHKILDAETRRIILEAVQALPPQRRQVFTMSRVERMSQAEIAEALGLSVNTVKVTMNRALKDLKQHLADKGIGGAALLYFWVVS